MEIPTPGDIVAEILKLTDDHRMDLFVHESDVDRVQESIERNGWDFRFRVHVSQFMTPGKMIVVDKSELLRHRNSISGSVTGTVERGAQSSDESRL
jgi:hypothetical protein